MRFIVLVAKDHNSRIMILLGLSDIGIPSSEFAVENYEVFQVFKK
jgi:hypothetical protein